MFLSRFSAVFLTFAFACGGAAHAQSWQFDTAGAPLARAVATPAAGQSVALVCTRKGAQPGANRPYDANNFELRIKAFGGGTAGQMVELEVQVDGKTLGRAPFLNTGAASGLVTLLPRAHPLTAAIRSGAVLRVTDVASGRVLDVPLGGSEAAIAQIERYCDAAAPVFQARSQPSFDCARATTLTEKAICADPELGRLDRDLAGAFKARRDAMSGAARDALVSEQRDWLKLRNTCANNTNCLRGSMQGRLARLDGSVTAAAPAQPQPAPQVQVQPQATQQVQVQPQAQTAPTAAAPAPLPAAALATTIFDVKEIARRFTIEAVRQRPDLLDNQRLLENWYTREIAPGQGGANALRAMPQAQRTAELNRARMAISQLVASTPAGPFLVGRQAGHGLANAPITAQGLGQSDLTKRQDQDGRYSHALGVYDLSNIYLAGRLSIRARSRFDTTFVAADRAVAETIRNDARNLKLNVAILVDDVMVVGAQGSQPQIIASGEVRHVGLYRHAPRGTPGFDPGALVYRFAPLAPRQPVKGLASVARRLNMQMAGDMVLDGQSGVGSSSRLTELVRLMAARNAGVTAPLNEQMRQYVFSQLATPIERDDVVPPAFLSPYKNAQRALRFDAHVDEFEKAELTAKVDTVLWPRIMAELPDTPIDGIALTNANLREYDSARGGFPVSASVNALGLAAYGRFPALKSLPDFLPVPVDQARLILQRLEVVGGPGARNAMFAVRYRVTNVAPQAWDAQGGPEITVEPLSLSLHARVRYEPGDDPLADPIANFDLAAYRGPVRPVASADRTAFWAEVNGWTRNSYDDVAAAAVALSEDTGFAERLVQSSNAVTSASTFDKARVEQEMRATIAGLSAPDELVLDGWLTVQDYDPATGSFPVGRVEFNIPYGQLGLTPTGLAMADRSAFEPLKVEPDTARRMVESGNSRNRNQFEFTARVKPVLVARERNREQLYVELVRMVVKSRGTDGTGLPAAYVDIRPDPADAAPAAPAPAASADGPEAVPLDAEYLDLLMVARQGDTLNALTFERMFMDRRLYELVAASLGQDPVWGRFFDDPSVAMNAVEMRAALERFTAWTRARAKALPETVYVRDHGIGMLGNTLYCGMLSTPPDRDFERYLPPAIAKRLTEMNYTRMFQQRTALERAKSRAAFRLPYAHYMIYGRPSLSAGNVAKTDSRQSSCARIARMGAQKQLAQSAHWDAMVTLNNLFRIPQKQGATTELRHYGTVTVGEPGAGGVVEVTMDVTRTEILPVEAAPEVRGHIRYRTPTVMDAEALAALLPAPPSATDILGMTPGMDWAEARKIAAERLPDAIVAEADGPPQSYREVVQNSLFGPEVQFQAFRNGHLFLDPAKGEGLALLREATRDPDRLLAIGRYRSFDATQASQEAVIGALLRKYGEAPELEDDQSRHGPKPGQILTWGNRTACLPRMRGEVNADAIPREDDKAYVAGKNLSRLFRAPQMQYAGSSGFILETCPPIVWASVGEDREKRLHLTVWVLDMALLNEVAQIADKTAKADGGEGSADLIEKAADIDL